MHYFRLPLWGYWTYFFRRFKLWGFKVIVTWPKGFRWFFSFLVKVALFSLGIRFSFFRMHFCYLQFPFFSALFIFMLPSAFPGGFSFLMLDLSWPPHHSPVFASLLRSIFFSFWRPLLDREAFFLSFSTFPLICNISIRDFLRNAFLHWFYQCAFHKMQYPLPNTKFSHHTSIAVRQVFLLVIELPRLLFTKLLLFIFFNFQFFLLNLYIFLPVLVLCFRGGNYPHFQNSQSVPRDLQWFRPFRWLQRWLPALFDWIVILVIRSCELVIRFRIEVLLFFFSFLVRVSFALGVDLLWFWWWDWVDWVFFSFVLLRFGTLWSFCTFPRSRWPWFFRIRGRFSSGIGGDDT